jgi:hypothetical protein
VASLAGTIPGGAFNRSGGDSERANNSAETIELQVLSRAADRPVYHSRTFPEGGGAILIVAMPKNEEVPATCFGACNEQEENRPRPRLGGEAVK